MPNLPVSIENDVTIQNATNGQVDYLQFQGNTLTHSRMFDYGIGGMNIVADGIVGFLPSPAVFTLAAQNPTTGVVDFLGLDLNGNLVSTALSSSLPTIVGEGLFGTMAPGQAGPTFVSQLANGELDFLGFNSSGALIASDLVANSVGLGHVVGAAVATNGNPAFPAFANVGSSTNFDVITQLPNGSLDAIGFSGSFAAKSLSVSASDMLPGSAGSAPVGAVNTDNFDFGQNIINQAGGQQGFQAVSQLASGQLDILHFDSGYSDPANQGVLYASDLLTPSFPGFNVVNANSVNNQLFPIT
jgi:hypothetical protein